jgi:metallo-beta-lactamase class B
MKTHGRFELVCPTVFRVGGSNLSGDGDCLVYALDLGELVLIDCGVGPGWQQLRDNLEAAKLQPDSLHTLVLTHAHVDHIGAAARIASDTGCRVVAHALDTPAIESGDPTLTVARLYGVSLETMRVDHPVEGPETRLEFSKGALRLIHTPGHTPGSMVAVLTVEGQTVLFGQDIHGPFDDSFGSDISAWRRSMQALLTLKADILCEGHFGVMRPASSVKRFIEGQLAAHR